MKTLIELYDERPLENVLSTEVFRPERTVYLCPQEIAQDKKRQEQLRSYYQHRGINAELVFVESSRYSAYKLKSSLQKIVETYPDCVLDITGGSDSALFAGGLVSAELGLPAFTYSRKKNRFFNIYNAPFEDGVECTLSYDVEDCFLMAGGAVRQGRVDNAVLKNYMTLIDPFFSLYLVHRTNWAHIVNYLQRVSQLPPEAPLTLHVDGAYTVKGERGSRISAPEAALVGLEKIGMLQNLVIKRDERVSFDFADGQIRTWLRDIGSVLELYVYKACLDTGIFQDVRTSVIVTNVAHAVKTRWFDSENRVAGYALTNSLGRGVTATLAYDGSRMSGMTFVLPNGGTFSTALTRNAARPDLVTRRAYSANGSSIYSYDTSFDLLGRPVNATDSQSLARSYLYNKRNELAAATIGTNAYEYAYDTIGNRTAASANSVTNTYAANNLNQYTQIDASQLTYDNDGNLTQDDRFAYTYDAENRLLSVRPISPTEGALAVVNAYDHKHRRVGKTVERFDGEEWQTVETHAFVYDGGNIVLERIAFADGLMRTVEYFWGNDFLLVPADVRTKEVQVRSAAKLYWDQFVYERKVGDGREVVVHVESDEVAVALTRLQVAAYHLLGLLATILRLLLDGEGEAQRAYLVELNAVPAQQGVADLVLQRAQHGLDVGLCQRGAHADVMGYLVRLDQFLSVRHPTDGLILEILLAEHATPFHNLIVDFSALTSHFRLFHGFLEFKYDKV